MRGRLQGGPYDWPAANEGPPEGGPYDFVGAI
jgi:hypothetical protein